MRVTTLISSSIVYALIALYPLTIYFGLSYFEPRVLAAYLLLLVLMRFCFLNNRNRLLSDRKIVSAFLLLGIFLAMFALASNELQSLKLYPVLVNFSLLAAFVNSLLHPPTVIERLARIQEPALPESGVRYTRRVTIIWCFFFLFNGLMALFTSLSASTAFWTLYNGLIAYLLIAALFFAELVYRSLFLKKHES